MGLGEETGMGEAEYITSPTLKVAIKIKKDREDCQTLMQQEVKFHHRVKQGRVYEHGNKAWKLLAWLAWREEGQKWIHKLRGREGVMVETLASIVLEMGPIIYQRGI